MKGLALPVPQGDLGRGHGRRRSPHDTGFQEVVGTVIKCQLKKTSNHQFYILEISQTRKRRGPQCFPAFCPLFGHLVFLHLCVGRLCQAKETAASVSDFLSFLSRSSSSKSIPSKKQVNDSEIQRTQSRSRLFPSKFHWHGQLTVLQWYVRMLYRIQRVLIFHETWLDAVIQHELVWQALSSFSHSSPTLSSRFDTLLQNDLSWIGFTFVIHVSYLLRSGDSLNPRKHVSRWRELCCWCCCS